MSKISRNKIFLVGVFFTLIMFISGIYAFTNISVLSIKNEINTGAVKIELDEYTINGGVEEAFDEGSAESIVPGQRVSLIPRVSNLGDSCYIRAKVTYSMNADKPVSVDNIDNTKGDWVKKEGYWYYKTILKTGDKLDVFKSFKVPLDMPNSAQGSDFEVNVTVEAIQAENFNPDFSADSPWDKVIVQKASEDAYKIAKVQLSTNAKIEYENNAQQYIEVPENFLGKLGHLVPGDLVEQEIELNNKTSDDIEYFVAIKKESDLSEKENNLLKQLELTISVDDKVVYQGSLFDVETVSLGKYATKTVSKAKFSVKVPEELDNEYSLINTSINWLFSVNAKEPVVVPTPQTGDNRIQIALSVFLISAVGLIVVLILERKIRKKSK